MPAAETPRPSVRLAHVSTGDGPPLLLLAGLGCDRDFWAGCIEPLSGRFRVIAPDSRGAGESPAPPGPYAAADLAADALLLLDELGVASCHVAGHSLGGMTALELALLAPSRVASLVLAGVPARCPPHLAFCLDVAGELWAGGCAPVPLVKTFLTWTTSGRRLADSAFVEGAVARQLSPRVPQSLDAWRAQAAAVTSFDVRARLGAIRQPVLVLAGEEDVLVPLAAQRELAAGLPGALLETSPGTGHNGVAEDAAAFCERLVRFVDGPGSGRSAGFRAGQGSQ